MGVYWWAGIALGSVVGLICLVVAAALWFACVSATEACPCDDSLPPEAARLAVVLVHGTFARHAQWARATETFAHTLLEEMSAERIRASIVTYCWSGKNSQLERLRASEGLRRRVGDLRRSGFERVVVVAHSHGGNVALLAAQPRLGASVSNQRADAPGPLDSDTSDQTPIDGIVALATPFQLYAEASEKRKSATIAALFLGFFGAVLGVSFLTDDEVVLALWVVLPITALMLLPLLLTAISVLRIVRSGQHVPVHHVEDEKERASGPDDPDDAVGLRHGLRWLAAPRSTLTRRLNPASFKGRLLVVSPVADEASLALIGAQLADLAGAVIRWIMNRLFGIAVVVFLLVLLVVGVILPVLAWLQATQENPESAAPIGDFFAESALADRGDTLSEVFAYSFWVFIGLATVLFATRALLRFVPGSEMLFWSARVRVNTQVAPPGYAEILTVDVGQRSGSGGLRHSSVYTAEEAVAVASWVTSHWPELRTTSSDLL